MVKRLAVLFFVIMLCSNICFAKRAYIHSLTDCINESSLIVIGGIQKIEYIEEKTVLTVSVFSVLKGAYGDKTIMIAGKYIVGPGKPVLYEDAPVADTGRAYIFFLNHKEENEKAFLLFDETDGMIYWSYPVAQEIKNRLSDMLPIEVTEKKDVSLDREYKIALVIGENFLSTLNLEPSEYKMIKAENMVSHGAYIGAHIWQLTYKSKKVIDRGKGGEIFIEVDVEAEKAKLLGYGE